MPEPSELKREARGILRGAAVSPYLFTLLLLAITFVMYCAREYVALPTTVARLEAVDPQLAAALPGFIRNASFPRLPGMFIQILTLLVGITLNAGEALYHLGVRRREEMPYSTLFDGFGLAGRVVTLGLLRTVIIYFLLMLFIVPGVIMAYRYRFAMYNLMEDPSLTAVEALRMSAAQTSGFKLDLFVLDLTFIGWLLLAGLTFGIFLIWLQPYYRQTDIGCFQAIKRIKGIGRLPEQELPVGDGFDPFA